MNDRLQARGLQEELEEPKGRAVIYLDTLGRFEGPVVRARSGGFVMTFSCSLQNWVLDLK